MHKTIDETWHANFGFTGIESLYPTLGIISGLWCLTIFVTDKKTSAVSRVHRLSASKFLNSHCLLRDTTPITRWELILGEGDAQELLRGGADGSKEIEAVDNS